MEGERRRKERGEKRQSRGKGRESIGHSETAQEPQAHLPHTNTMNISTHESTFKQLNNEGLRNYIKRALNVNERARAHSGNVNNEGRATRTP